jgi:lysophospholipase L1-like esterase
MPLGDSITYGSSAGVCYRGRLWDRMQALTGFRPDFVGSVDFGIVTDVNNEGHPGWEIANIADNIDAWLALYQPDLVLLHIGTNDTVRNDDLANAPARLDALVEQILTGAPQATLALATIILSGNPTVNQYVDTYNAAVRQLVATKQAEGKRVSLVDMNAAFLPSDLSSDQIHPTDAGYVHMGDIWFDGITSLLPTP